jgi:DNA-nicking Smr family endonuclease
LNKKISPDDIKAWDEFISGDKPLENKDKNLEVIDKKFEKIKKVDLHGYSLDTANTKIEEFILNCYQNKIFKIIVITGKGTRSNNQDNPYVSKDLSILKYSVPSFLKDNVNLKSIIKNISEANIKDGGSGAFYVYLNKIKE